MSVPQSLPYPELAELLNARDGLLRAWRNGIMDGELCQKRLAALTAPDRSGDQWRLRPGSSGAMLVRLSPSGQAGVADLADYQPPPPAPPASVKRLKRGALAVYAALWAVLAVAGLQAFVL